LRGLNGYFSSAAVVIPPPSVVEAFERTVASLLKRIRGNLFESSILAALRDALLPKLLSGEIRMNPESRELKSEIVREVRGG
jgi:type I restriction enzyme S subunit